MVSFSLTSNLRPLTSAFKVDLACKALIVCRTTEAARKLFAPPKSPRQFQINREPRRPPLSSSATAATEFSNPNLEPLFTAEQIQTRVAELGAEVARDYAGRTPLLVGVLKGACVFLSDLVRACDLRLGVEFMAISSYGSGMRSSGEVRIPEP